MTGLSNHRIDGCCYSIAHWRDGVACGSEEAKEAEVTIFGHPHHPRFRFQFSGPGKRPPEMDELLVALRHAFELGRKAKAKEVRDVIGAGGER